MKCTLPALALPRHLPHRLPDRLPHRLPLWHLPACLPAPQVQACRFIDQRAFGGLTPLHFAVVTGCLEAVQALLRAGASIMVKSGGCCAVGGCCGWAGGWVGGLLFWRLLHCLSMLPASIAHRPRWPAPRPVLTSPLPAPCLRACSLPALMPAHLCRRRGIHWGGLFDARVHPPSRCGHHQQHLNCARNPAGG